jgi:pimeloyl-ACP methyl ester carboxylesterase
MKESLPVCTMEKKSTSAGGVDTHYLEFGQGDATVLLLHGGLFSQDGVCADALVWEFNIPALARGMRVLALDMLGQGLTELPPSDAEYSYEGMVDHTRAFLEALGTGPVHLVGHDQGAMVALTVSMRWPEMVRSCVIVNSPCIAPSGDGLPNLTLEGMPEPRYSAASQRWVLERQAHTPHHIGLGRFLSASAAHAGSEKFGRLRNKLADERIARGLVRSTGQAKLQAFAGLRDKGLGVPSMLLWGTDDPMSSTAYVSDWGARPDASSAIAHARAIFDLLEQGDSLARMTLIPRAGYMPFRERPDAFNRLVQGFIQAVDADAHRD